MGWIEQEDADQFFREKMRERDDYLGFIRWLEGYLETKAKIDLVTAIQNKINETLHG